MTFYGAGNSLWPFPPRCVAPVGVEGSRVGTPERATQAWPIKGVDDLSENCAARRRTRPRAGYRTLSPAGSRMPVETPNQRDPAATHEERGVVYMCDFFSMQCGE